MADQSTKIYVPPKGTRGTRVMDFVFALMKPFAGREVKRYQKADGPEPKLFMGFPVLVLTTVGAKSGQERSTVLGGFPDGDNAWLIIASKGVRPRIQAGSTTSPPTRTRSGRRSAIASSRSNASPSPVKSGRMPITGWQALPRPTRAIPRRPTARFPSSA